MGKKPMVLETEGWVELNTTMSVAELRQFGPTTDLKVRSAAGGEYFEVLAQIDTGASHSCVGPALAAKLGGPTGQLLQHQAGGQPAYAPQHSCEILLPTGNVVNVDLTVLAGLSDPHQVLIGRDVLAFCRLVVDFTTGKWSLHLKTP